MKSRTILMRHYLITVGIFVLSGTQLKAQDVTKAEPKKPEAKVSVVALGPKPTRKYRHVEGGEAPVMLLAKPGETPPPRLYYKGKPDGDQKTRWLTFNVPFNNPSVLRPIPPDKPLVLFRKIGAGDDAKYQRYVTIPAGAVNSRRIFFLTPSVTGPTPWDKPPKVRTISLDQKSLIGKQFVLKNLSRFTVLHAFGDNVVSVAPTKIISYKSVKTGELYRLAAQYGTRKKIIYNTAVRLDGNGHVQLYVLYDTNPKTNSSRSVGVFRTMIPVREKIQPPPVANP